MAGAQRIGILTSGGDAPGMNPAIRAVVRAAVEQHITCIGIRRGYAGLINGDVFELTGSDVDGISRRGGTILYTARSEEFRTDEGVKKAAKVCKYLGIDGIIAIGGDGTFRGALELARQGIRVVGIPATIDNDMGCTEYTIGFDTACNTAMEAIDKLRDTGQSHDRVSVVEVMGRNAGHLALYTGIAAGASAVLIPEKEIDLEQDVIDVIRRGCIHGRRHHIIVVAEGVGYVNSYAKEIEKQTGLETRVTVLGYIQRGGAPSGRDRVSASMMGVRAVNVLCGEDEESRVIVARNGRFEDMPIEEALQMERKLDEEMYAACYRINTSYHAGRK
ncbi:MAG: 6-phosphofructokinase [Oscillospiraceae bacterium]|nr:6-phosphofructokinase [Oscillospiraceae bacterium]